MRRLPLLVPPLLVFGLAACDPKPEQASASPAPSTGSGGLSLSDALPSPTPDQTLPSMPPVMMGSFAFYEDFERGMARWRITGGHKGVGWHLLKASTCGGLYTMVLGRALNPSARFIASESFLTLTSPVRLPPGRRLQLKYDVKGAVTPPEAARIELQVQQGQGPWRALGAVPTARFPLMVSYRVDVTPFAGQALRLRFRGVTAATRTPHKGFYLDDIHLIQDERP